MSSLTLVYPIVVLSTCCSLIKQPWDVCLYICISAYGSSDLWIAQAESKNM